MAIEQFDRKPIGKATVLSSDAFPDIIITVPKGICWWVFMYGVSQTSVGPQWNSLYRRQEISFPDTISGYLDFQTLIGVNVGTGKFASFTQFPTGSAIFVPEGHRIRCRTIEGQAGSASYKLEFTAYYHWEKALNMPLLEP